MPEALRAAQLYNLVGIVFVIGSYRFFFQPDTISQPSSVIKRYNSGISSGLSCKSASIVITTFPSAFTKAIFKAADLP